MSSWTDGPGAVGRLSDDDRTTGAFTGDLGELRIETRRVLVTLLLGPAIDAQRQTKLWPVLLRDERILRSRLHELFLELVVDHEQQVAFTRQVVSNEIDVPILLRKASLTFLQSALLLYLREQLLQAEARGERAVVARDEMLERLALFEPGGTRDHAKFEKQSAGAVERAKELSLLRKLRGGEDRFEVSPTLKLLFPAEEIRELTQTYERLREMSAGQVSMVDDEVPGSDEEREE
ncbi:DUF4194 domain-containing protein [Corallococcus sp. M34]|uniref:DUF4194 domain-containing protein n=1 Tax=Citreicoccus inhibens TaxID=2849499 RepID=UPI001C23F525|nr:DUF4194 domain-containing protein [Citreicoccus inhibens]MBU8900725.1 DUF4194 domain-containing protein [Citreicoccus inhibens]